MQKVRYVPRDGEPHPFTSLLVSRIGASAYSDTPSCRANSRHLAACLSRVDETSIAARSIGCRRATMSAYEPLRVLPVEVRGEPMHHALGGCENANCARRGRESCGLSHRLIANRQRTRRELHEVAAVRMLEMPSGRARETDRRHGRFELSHPLTADEVEIERARTRSPSKSSPRRRLTRLHRVRLPRRFRRPRRQRPRRSASRRFPSRWLAAASGTPALPERCPRRLGRLRCRKDVLGSRPPSTSARRVAPCSRERIHERHARTLNVPHVARRERQPVDHRCCREQPIDNRRGIGNTDAPPHLGHSAVYWQ